MGATMKPASPARALVTMKSPLPTRTRMWSEAGASNSRTGGTISLDVAERHRDSGSSHSQRECRSCNDDHDDHDHDLGASMGIGVDHGSSTSRHQALEVLSLATPSLRSPRLSRPTTSRNNNGSKRDSGMGRGAARSLTSNLSIPFSPMVPHSKPNTEPNRLSDCAGGIESSGGSGRVGVAGISTKANTASAIAVIENPVTTTTTTVPSSLASNNGTTVTVGLSLARLGDRLITMLNRLAKSYFRSQ